MSIICVCRWLEHLNGIARSEKQSNFFNWFVMRRRKNCDFRFDKNILIFQEPAQIPNKALADSEKSADRTTRHNGKTSKNLIKTIMHQFISESNQWHFNIWPLERESNWRKKEREPKKETISQQGGFAFLAIKFEFTTFQTGNCV